MRKKYSNLKKVGMIVGGLFLGANIASPAYSQATIVSPISSQEIDSFFTRTGDWIFNTGYLNKKPINRNEITDINQRIRGGNVTKIHVLDAIEGFREGIDYLNSKEGIAFFGNKKDEKREAQRLLQIGRYNNFITGLNRITLPSKKSIEALSSAVYDGIVEPQELINVEDGIYVIEKQGIDKEVGKYRVFDLTEVVSDTTPGQYQSKISELENRVSGFSEQTQTSDKISIIDNPKNTPLSQEEIEEAKDKIDNDYKNKGCPAPQRQLPLSQVPTAQGTDTRAPTPIENSNPETQKQGKGYGNFVFDVNANLESFGFELGGGYNFNKTWGIEAGLAVGVIPGTEILNVTTPRSNKGIYANLRKKEMGFGVGPWFGGRAGLLTARVGFNYWNLDTITREQLMQNGEKLGDPNIPPTDSRNLFSFFVEGKLKVPAGKYIDIDGGVGYDTKRKIYGILGITAHPGTK